MEPNSSLDEMRQLIESGNRQAAAAMLAALVQREPANEDAWLLLAEAVNTPEQAEFCREKARRAAQSRMATRIGMPPVPADVGVPEAVSPEEAGIVPQVTEEDAGKDTLFTSRSRVRAKISERIGKLEGEIADLEAGRSAASRAWPVAVALLAVGGILVVLWPVLLAVLPKLALLGAASAVLGFVAVAGGAIWLVILWSRRNAANQVITKARQELQELRNNLRTR